ncbi:MAG: DivIVA domain-containing protein [Oscillospiraceae bacterium]|nr:DivIVA domain-containing protein [Oscillospiraceae bacterium]MBQ6850268.1 DivIVA domain-containing protein [Oscillospiraceae bacterium]
MFTADEIRQITFEKVMRGYRPEDVESFMENIADEFEALEKEKRDLEEKLYLLAEKVEQYKAEEESIKTTLINAQRLGESIVSDARVKADNVIREATIKKNDIISSAYNEIEGTEEVLNRLRKEVSDFKRNILSLYKTHIESLSTLPDERAEEQHEEIVEEELVQEETVMDEPVQETVAVEEPVVLEDKFKSVSSLFNEE